jgi:tRNA(Leu) C34 or U34 (ribose-2'-O)-methylase TrmL
VLRRHFAGDSFEYTLQANNVKFKLRTSELLQEDSEVNLFFEERDLFVFGKEGHGVNEQVVV